MAVSSVVRKSELEGALRLDAEYYRPKYLATLDALRALKATPLEAVARPARRRFKAKEGEPFSYIEISEVNTSTGAVNAMTLRGEEAPDRAQWIVRGGDVIVSTVRPARNAVALVSEAEDDFVCSSGFAVLKAVAVRPEFLFVYLKARPIVELLDRRTTATMYPAVSWQDVLGIPVFSPDKTDEQFVAERVTEAQAQSKRSESLYLWAERMVVGELGWESLDLSQPKWWMVPVSRARGVGRLDADHFQPKYDRLIGHLEGTGKARSLGEIARYIKRGVQPRYVEGGGVLAINSRYVGKQLINTEQAERTDVAFWDDNPRARAYKHDVIMNSTGWGTIGRTNCVLHDGKTVVDNHVTIIRVKDGACDPVYLAVYLNSRAGLMQTDKWLSGSSGQIELYPEDIAGFVVYMASEKVQARVADLVMQSHDARQKARALLEEAKRKVEALIEGAQQGQG